MNIEVLTDEMRNTDQREGTMRRLSQLPSFAALGIVVKPRMPFFAK